MTHTTQNNPPHYAAFHWLWLNVDCFLSAVLSHELVHGYSVYQGMGLILEGKREEGRNYDEGREEC